MRACLVLLAAAFANSNVTLAGPVSGPSTASTLVNDFQPEGSSKRFLRSYDMSDLNVNEGAGAGEEERGIDLTKLDDVINVVKGDKVMDAAKLDDVINAAKNNKVIDAAKADDVINTANADKVIDAAKANKVIDAAKADKVIDAAKADDVIDEAKLDDLLKPDKIALALKDPDEEMALFAQWHQTKELSTAILKRLHANGGFFKNTDIIFRYNGYRTRFAYNQQLTPWLDTKTLDATLNALQNHGTKKMTEQFEVWLKDRRTKQQIADALKPHPKIAKKYKALETHYGHFVDFQPIKAKRAAAEKAKKAAEEAAEAKKAAEVVEAS
ncbi:hypothetical protein KRP22_009565 [Phytophthora ramorum]|nr:hypothetical protein KRP22_8398 [Phytophthora ramorum]